MTARDRLFAWVFSLRVELLRVQYRSIDNRARGDRSNPSPFALMREAGSAASSVNSPHLRNPTTTPTKKNSLRF